MSEQRLYAEDLSEGMEFELGTWEMDEAAIVEFARQWDPQPMHTDPAAAKDGPWGGLIASGLHTLGVYQRLMIEAISDRIATGVGRSLAMKFVRPVRPGDVLTGTSRVAEITLRGPGRDAIFALHTQLRDQDGNVVLEVELDASVRSRG
ncbi:MAG: MaoC/PaaZ C-terminal domain-containing protein [Sporichthyaceae bacterium]